MEEEIGTMVGRLTGDGSSYEGMMKHAEEATTHAKEHIEKEGKEVERFQERLEKFGQGVGAAMESAVGFEFLKGSLEHFAEAEQNSIKLSATLQGMGRDVAGLTKEYQEFGEEMSKVTNMSKSEVVNIVRVAESYGLTGEAAKEAARNAIAFSSASGVSAEHTLRLLKALEEGHVTEAMRMGRMIPQLRGIKDEATFAAAATRLLAVGMDVAQQQANSWEGVTKRLSKTWEDFQEELGKTVMQFLKPIVAGLQAVAEWLNEMDEETKQAIVVGIALVSVVTGATAAFHLLGLAINVAFGGIPYILAAVVAGIVLLAPELSKLYTEAGGLAGIWQTVKKAALDAWEWTLPVRQALESLFSFIKETAVSLWDGFKDAAKTAWDAISFSIEVDWKKIRDDVRDGILFVEFSFRHLGDFAELTWTGMKLGAVAFFNMQEYQWTVVMPTTLQWFADNWKEIFQDMYENTKTVFVNLGENFKSIFSNMKDIIKGNIDVEDLWKPLSDGFQRTAKELVIPDRVIGDMEQKLMDDFIKQGEELNQSWDEFRKEKLKEFAEFMPEHEVEEGKKHAAAAGLAIGNEFKKGLKFDVALAGSAEALARIAQQRDMIAGATGKPVAKQDAAATGSAEAETRKEQTGILKDIRDVLKEKKPTLEVAGLS